MCSKVFLISVYCLIAALQIVSTQNAPHSHRCNSCQTRTESRVHEIFADIKDIKLEVIASLGYRGYVYYVSPNFMSWDNARVYCQSAGGDLAQYGIRVAQYKEEIAEAMIEPLYPRSRVWIGLRKINDQWTWNDGTNATDEEIMWDYNQPDLSGNCGNFFDDRSDYRTDDDDCSKTDLFRALCEREKPSFGPDGF